MVKLTTMKVEIHPKQTAAVCAALINAPMHIQALRHLWHTPDRQTTQQFLFDMVEANFVTLSDDVVSRTEEQRWCNVYRKIKQSVVEARTPRQIARLVTLSAHCDYETGDLFCSLQKVSEWLNCSLSQAKRHLRKWLKDGLLQKVKRGHYVCLFVELPAAAAKGMPPEERREARTETTQRTPGDTTEERTQERPEEAKEASREDARGANAKTMQRQTEEADTTEERTERNFDPSLSASPETSPETTEGGEWREVKETTEEAQQRTEERPEARTEEETPRNAPETAQRRQERQERTQGGTDGGMQPPRAETAPETSPEGESNILEIADGIRKLSGSTMSCVVSVGKELRFCGWELWEQGKRYVQTGTITLPLSCLTNAMLVDANPPSFRDVAHLLGRKCEYYRQDVESWRLHSEQLAKRLQWVTRWQLASYIATHTETTDYLNKDEDKREKLCNEIKSWIVKTRTEAKEEVIKAIQRYNRSLI